MALQDEPTFERVPGVRRWVRPFEVRWSRRRAAAVLRRLVHWKPIVIAGSAAEQKAVSKLEALIRAPSRSGDAGVLIWLGDGADVTSTRDLFRACRYAWADEDVRHLAICHAGLPVGGFARSLTLEARFDTVLVIERALAEPSVDRIALELGREIDAFGEVRLDPGGDCSEPHFIATRPQLSDQPTLDASDVILVTGGAKGIAAECALRLAARTAAALILCGRSDVDDPAIASTLERARRLGLRCRYATADVTEPDALHAAVRKAEAETGNVTALVHAAGLNRPRLFMDISDEDLERALASKTTGFLAAVEASGPHLRRVVTFGSILARMGIKTQAHYALANAWQSKLAEHVAHDRPLCRVLSIEWSIWNRLSAGHRSTALDYLARYGVDPIEIEDGVGAFERLVLGGAAGTLIVTSRFGPPSFVSLGTDDGPHLSFFDRIVLHYPLLELVAETGIALPANLQPIDYRIGGMVLGLEAMAQAACALATADGPIRIESASFRHPILTSETPIARVRILALGLEDGRVDVVIRGVADAFATDCMRATFCFAPSHFRERPTWTRETQRFVSPLPTPYRSWAGRQGFTRLVLGDPGTRDALLRGLALTVPDLPPVPLSVAHITPCLDGAATRIEAVQTLTDADTVTLDIVGLAADGSIVECWKGACFETSMEPLQARSGSKP